MPKKLKCYTKQRKDGSSYTTCNKDIKENKPKPKPKPKPKSKPKPKPKPTTTKALQKMPFDVGTRISEEQMKKRGDKRIDAYDIKLKKGTKLRRKGKDGGIYTIVGKVMFANNKLHYKIVDKRNKKLYGVWTNNIYYEKDGKGYYFTQRILQEL